MDDLTLRHIFLGLAALEAIGAIVYAMAWMRHSSELRGTPLYARGRDARRMTLLLGVSAAILVVLAILTPLGDIAIGSGG